MIASALIGHDTDGPAVARRQTTGRRGNSDNDSHSIGQCGMRAHSLHNHLCSGRSIDRRLDSKTNRRPYITAIVRLVRHSNLPQDDRRHVGLGAQTRRVPARSYVCLKGRYGFTRRHIRAPENSTGLLHMKRDIIAK